MIKLQNVEIRQFSLDTDGVAEINALLKRAYQPLTDAGMNFAASEEDLETTRKNLLKGEAHIALYENEIVGCVIIRFPKIAQPGWRSKGPNWFDRPDVANFGRFAVNPAWQGMGLGNQILETIEARVRSLGYAEISLDTSERADHLIRFYEKRGYRFIEHHQWIGRNYRSVVMSKTLRER